MHSCDDWTRPSDPIHLIRVVWGSWPGMKQAKQEVDVIFSVELCGYSRLRVALHCHVGKCQVRYFARND